MKALALISTSVIVLACQAPPAATPAEGPSRPSAATATPDETPHADPAMSEADALIREVEGEPASKVEGKPDSGASEPVVDTERGHEVVYRVKPDGLTIEIAHATFIPSVKTKRVKGGYLVEIEVDAKTTEDLVITETEAGPLALAGKIRGVEETKFGDKKQNPTDQAFTPERSRVWKRSWPNADQTPLTPGESAEIQVGLWGLGDTASSKRPVRKFFVVKVKVDAKGASALVEAPK